MLAPRPTPLFIIAVVFFGLALYFGTVSFYIGVISLIIGFWGLGAELYDAYNWRRKYA